MQSICTQNSDVTSLAGVPSTAAGKCDSSVVSGVKLGGMGFVRLNVGMAAHSVPVAPPGGGVGAPAACVGVATPPGGGVTPPGG
jgi:hypothetical protein